MLGLLRGQIVSGMSGIFIRIKKLESRAGRAPRMISKVRAGDRRAAPAHPRPGTIQLVVRQQTCPGKSKDKRRAPRVVSAGDRVLGLRPAGRTIPVCDPLTVRLRPVKRASPTPLCSTENMVFVRVAASGRAGYGEAALCCRWWEGPQCGTLQSLIRDEGPVTKGKRLADDHDPDADHSPPDPTPYAGRRLEWLLSPYGVSSLHLHGWSLLHFGGLGDVLRRSRPMEPIRVWSAHDREHGQRRMSRASGD